MASERAFQLENYPRVLSWVWSTAVPVVGGLCLAVLCGLVASLL
jgi:hypothetical protein